MLVEESETAGGAVAAGEVVQPGRIIREATPRLVRDAFGPLATFFVGWKLFGLTAGIFLALAFGTLVFVHERRQGRPAALVRVAMVIVCIRAVVGLSSGSATVYLAQEIGIDLLLATAVLSGLATGRPLAAWVARDVFPFTPEMRASSTFAEVMRTVTLVWGFYFLARAAVRLLALLSLSTNSYVLVIALTDVPFLVALLAWSVHYTTATFRRSGQWGALFAGPPVPPVATKP